MRGGDYKTNVLYGDFKGKFAYANLLFRHTKHSTVLYKKGNAKNHVISDLAYFGIFDVFCRILLKITVISYDGFPRRKI